jgi:excinuclease ABC subunit C
MSLIQNQQKKLPKSPGVYIFKDKAKKIIYIGKATVLKTRVASYFRSDIDLKTSNLMKNAYSLNYKDTESALEALFLEAELIKKHKPFYNIKQKDDKTNVYLVITDEEFPRLELTRPTALHRFKIKKSYGPFQSKKELAQALKILRRIIPYHSSQNMKKPCFHYQIKLCPGPCAGVISKKDYLKNINKLSQIFEGKKVRVIKNLEKEMKKLSKIQEFEKAAILRDTLFALKNHRDINFSSKDPIKWKIVKNIPKRLEAYDISNISGKQAVGSMIVFHWGRADKTEYRKFKIRYTQETPNDTAMLKEVLERRFNNNWERPSVIFIDGGMAQIRAAIEVLRSLNLKIPVVSAAKGPSRKNFRLFKSHKNLAIDRDLLKQASVEAHRFAITYHRKLRNKEFLK